MIIYLDENKKKVLKTLLLISQKNDGKKRLQILKNELCATFDMDEECIYDTIDALAVTRFLDISFENKQQIVVVIYKEMIEEQLDINKNYVRKYKEWPDESTFYSKNSGVVSDNTSSTTE